MIRLIGIGDNTVDIYETEGMQYPGGNAVNVAVQAKRYGAQASYLGCLGRDARGDLIYGSLVAEGIDVSHVRRLDGHTAWSRIRHHGPDRVFVGSDRGVRGCYDLTAADASFIGTHDVVHTSVHSDLDDRILWLRKCSRILSYDYSEHWKRPSATATMAHVDIAFLSGSSLSEGECEALLQLVAKAGAGIVVVTRGAAGACALHDDELVSREALATRIVDTLGAGDGFIAGFLLARTAGMDLATCLEHGARQAAKVCLAKGGFGHGVPIEPDQSITLN